ncbi:hypothetical protein GCM10009738_29480 [Kitasatospora viridis]
MAALLSSPDSETESDSPSVTYRTYCTAHRSGAQPLEEAGTATHTE